MVVAVALAGLLISQTPPVRTAAITAALVPQMLGLNVFPKGAADTDPRVETITYGTPADRMDVYLPVGAKAGDQLPAVVLALGVHPVPIDDP